MFEIVFQLLFTAVVVPLISYHFDAPLTEKQSEVLGFAANICFWKAVYVFVVSTITGNVSQVDKLWSIMPSVYAWAIAHSAGM